VQPHPTFGRDGDHLTVRVPVSYAEAALGAEIPVPTLEGGAVTLRLRAGTQSGSRHRVKGRGIRAGQREGDLIVTVDVAVPTRLGDAERAAIERLAEVTEAIPR
jgi:molecular chaperone DnaJ